MTLASDVTSPHGKLDNDWTALQYRQTMVISRLEIVRIEVTEVAGTGR